MAEINKEKKLEVSVIIPCLNEEDAIGICIDKVQEVFERESIAGEIIVVDNGSTDKSIEIAESKRVKVEYQPVKGYGSAYLKGIESAKGQVVAMGDGDNTYDFLQLKDLLDSINEGNDFVVGSRFKGSILKGAMPFLNRYIGNPVLTGFLNLFYKADISDAHSGFRAVKKDILKRLELRTTGMEFASEMIVKALKEGIRIKEVPITYSPRKGESKLSPLSDAWRHMRFMLLFSPDWLFMIPGLTLFLCGISALIVTGSGWFSLFGHRFDIHAMVFFTFFSLAGFQIINLGLFAKTYSFIEGFDKENRLLTVFYRNFNLEKGIIIGSSFLGIGSVSGIYIVSKWIKTGFGPLSELKLSLLFLLFMVIGLQIIFSSFFLSLLGLSRNGKSLNHK